LSRVKPFLISPKSDNDIGVYKIKIIVVDDDSELSEAVNTIEESFNIHIIESTKEGKNLASSTLNDLSKQF